MDLTNSTNFKGKKILVVGLGVSGFWTARFFVSKGAHVTITECRPEKDLDPKLLKASVDMGIRLETGGHHDDTFFSAEMILISPGVPHDMDLLVRASEKGIPVTGELEFASRLLNTPIIAVTGTNGKSTVTALIGEMLQAAGIQAFVGGNIGTPLMAHVASPKKVEYVVVEVSSFQLDTIQSFSPFISILLNITPDHLDRYPSYNAYVKSKLKIFTNQGPGDYLILNDEDETLSALEPHGGVSVLRYGLKKKPDRQAVIQHERIDASLNGKKSKSYSLEAFALPGSHNKENLLAVVLTGITLGIDDAYIQHTINHFKGLPNRLERVAEWKDVRFYNDSKATNVDAAVKSVMSFDRPLILIAGGRHKGESYDALAGAAKGNVKRAVLLGESTDLLAKSFEGLLPFSMAHDLPDAVSIAVSWAEPGDVVLLAPACASFDMFSDYAQRGMVFRKAVKDMIGG